MNPGEIVHYAVSAASAVICLYVRSELRQQRMEINEEIGKLRVESIQRDNATRQWVWANFRPGRHSSSAQDCIAE